MKVKQINPIKTYALRLNVLKTCEAYEYKYKGDFDAGTIHLASVKNEEIIGVLSLMTINNVQFTGKQFQLRGMAIAKDFQNNGIGNLLVQAAMNLAKKQDLELIWCNAREKAVGFYQKNGFEIIGARFYIENVGFHFLMYKKCGLLSK